MLERIPNVLKAIILITPSELEQSEIDTLLSMVSLERQERINKFRFKRDTQNCLLGDVLTRIEICRVTGLNNNQLEFSFNAYGKPFLVNTPSIHFNVSHAGHYVVCVIANEPVGIDIELMKPIDIKIAERFFTSDETEYIKTKDHTLRFYEIWTKKESHIKWEGKGLHKPLPSFSVFDGNEKERLIYHTVYHDSDAICHVCATEQSVSSIRIIDIETLMKSVNHLGIDSRGIL